LIGKMKREHGNRHARHPAANLMSREPVSIVILLFVRTPREIRQSPGNGWTPPDQHLSLYELCAKMLIVSAEGLTAR